MISMENKIKKQLKVKDKKAHILVVDDVPSALIMLQKILSEAYTVTIAQNGKQALAELKKGGISMVLSDIIMPDMSGIELLKIIKSDKKLSSVPVMMITSYGNTENEIEALRLGALDVIQKPFVPQVLLGRIRNLLELKLSEAQTRQRIIDLRRLREQDEALRTAEYDELTGVLTRQAFYRHVRTYLDTHTVQNLEILRFDLDNFSTINDIMGVKVGDKLLSEIGALIVKYSGSTTEIPIAGHIEADHFAILYDASCQSAEELFNFIKDWINKNEAEYHLKCRAGVYRISDKALEPAVMCDRALQALRTTKGDYIQRIARYDDSMRKKRLEEQRLTDEMLPALAAGQFVVYYQPQMNYSTGELIGAEALVRWAHPEMGMLSPAVFLPLFERNGLIIQLDNYVWESVCRQLAEWRSRFGDDIAPVSVNISRIDTYGEDLCQRLASLTDKYKIPKAMLRLEITESAYVDDAKWLCKTAEQLSQAGFTIEMDDFGSAYSSLNMLKDISVDILKLDMKFLSDTKNPVRGGNILSSVVRMAHWLQLPVIAEGVEDKQQADYLCSIGCMFMQGYYFSRPVPVEEYEKFMLKRVGGETDLYKNGDMSEAEQFWNASTQTALIFNSYVGGAIILQRSGNQLEMLRANEEFFEVLHTTREEYFPAMLNVWSRFDDANRKKYNDMLDKAAKGEENVKCDILSCSLSGKQCEWTRNRAKLLANNAGNEIFYVSVENVTAEKTAQEQLVQQKNMLDRLYNGVPCGIVDYIVVENKPVVVNFNDTAWKMAGYKNREEFCHEACATQWKPLVHEEDIQPMLVKVREALKNKGSITTECRIVRQDGSVFWSEVRLQCVVMPDGEVSLQSVFFDISDRREHEMQQYGKFLFSFFDEVFLWDFQTNTSHTLKGKEPYARAGNIIPDLNAMTADWVENHIVPEDRQHTKYFMRREYLESQCGQNKTPCVEYRVMLENGKETQMRVVAFALDKNRFVICCRDVTEEKQAANKTKEIAVLQATLTEQERYRVIVEKTDTAVIEWNHVTGEFFHSGMYDKYALSDCSPDDIINNSADLATVFHEDISLLEQFFKDEKRNGGTKQVVLRMLMKDGTYRWTRIREALMFDDNGTLLRTIGTFTDVDDEMRAKEKLRETSVRLQNIIANVPVGVGIYRIEANGKVVPIYISDRTCQMFGFTREEYDAQISSGMNMGFMQDVIDLTAEEMRATQKGEPIVIPRVAAKRKDGSRFWVRLTCSFVRNGQEPVLCYATLFDISNFIEAKHMADSAKELYQLVMESAETITFDYSVADDSMHMSMLSDENVRTEKHYLDYLSYLKSSLSNIDEESKAEVTEALHQAIEKEMHGELDFHAVGLDNIPHWYHTKYVSLAEGGKVYRVIGRIDNFDSVISAQDARLEEATLDKVTGLRNKDAGRAAIDKLMQQRPASRRDYMLFLDIDNFKCLNDTLGHLEADNILSQIGVFLKSVFSEEGSTARFGGDEFIVYMISPGDAVDVLGKAQMLLNGIREIKAGGKQLQCSIGITDVFGAMRSFDEAFICADKAMYLSKHNGKNRISFYKDE